MSKLFGAKVETVKPGDHPGEVKVEFQDKDGRKQRVHCAAGWAEAAISKSATMVVPELPWKKKGKQAKKQRRHSREGN